MRPFWCILGYHDWQLIDRDRISYCGEYADKVCLNCKEIRWDYSNLEKKVERRRRKAKRILQEKGEDV